MRALLRFASLAAACAACLVTTTALADDPKVHGGWGEAFIAPMLGKLRGLDAGLQSPALLGSDFSGSAYATQIGGGGGFLLSKSWLVKAIGFGVIGATTQTSRGSARTFAGGGTLQVGYVVVNDDSWLVWPYVGLGGMGISPKIENHTSAPMVLGTSSVQPGASSEIGVGAFTAEIGVAGRRLMLFGSGGFVVGAELGALLTLASQSWTDSAGKSVSGVGSGKLDGGYLRITVGGGSFDEATKK